MTTGGWEHGSQCTEGNAESACGETDAEPLRLLNNGMVGYRCDTAKWHVKITHKVSLGTSVQLVCAVGILGAHSRILKKHLLKKYI